MLIGGCDDNNAASLYYMDYMGSCQQIPFGAHGYGAYFTLSVMDRFYKSDLTINDGIELIKKCIKELQLRFLINLPKFICKIADKDGIREIDLGEYSL